MVTPNPDINWHPFDEGRSLGQHGPEGGIILEDEEHIDGARITLERGGSTAPYAVTCAISGWLVHTRFFSNEEDARRGFEEMKPGLTTMLSLIPNRDDSDIESKMADISTAIRDFIKRFP